MLAKELMSFPLSQPSFIAVTTSSNSAEDKEASKGPWFICLSSSSCG
jgi:hypothetical protein